MSQDCCTKELGNWVKCVSLVGLIGQRLIFGDLTPGAILGCPALAEKASPVPKKTLRQRSKDAVQRLKEGQCQ